MKDFKVGDRVICLFDGGGDDLAVGPREGDTGTIMEILLGVRLPFGVKFDKKVDSGHSLEKTCPIGYGWWCSKEALAFYVDEQRNIVVESDDVLSIL